MSWDWISHEGGRTWIWHNRIVDRLPTVEAGGQSQNNFKLARYDYNIGGCRLRLDTIFTVGAGNEHFPKTDKMGSRHCRLLEDTSDFCRSMQINRLLRMRTQ
jgi:hypothetical protein